MVSIPSPQSSGQNAEPTADTTDRASTTGGPCFFKSVTIGDVGDVGDNGDVGDVGDDGDDGDIIKKGLSHNSDGPFLYVNSFQYKQIGKEKG